MSISALSSNLVTDLSQPQWQNPFKEIRQDFQQLAGALQSGDLSGAQSAYSSIQQLLQASTNSSNSSSPTTIQSDFATLGQALASGSLSQAQSAFSQLQTDFQAARQSRDGAVNGPTPGQDQYVPSSSQGPNAVGQALQDYTQLASDIQSGNLTDAQAAYTSLQQLVGNPSSSNASTIQTDFATLGKAIQSEDVTQAQSAFAQLQSDYQTANQPPSAAGTTTASTTTQAQDQSTTTTAPVQNPVQQVRQDYAELANALQSGNLTTAQSAFTALQQALQTQSGPSTASTTTSATSGDPIANDLSALGQALSSSNLTQAQSAFSQLQTDIRTAQQSATSQSQGVTPWHRAGGHGHHHHGGGGYGSESSTSSSSNASNTNSGVNVYA